MIFLQTKKAPGKRNHRVQGRISKGSYRKSGAKGLGWVAVEPGMVKYFARMVAWSLNVCGDFEKFLYTRWWFETYLFILIPNFMEMIQFDSNLFRWIGSTTN